MNEKKYASLGIIGPFVAYFSIGISILLSPWFRWQNNALSDLGHSLKSEVAPIFNFGLLLTGFILTFYSLTIYRKHAKYTSICLIASAITLQFVATFDEAYGFIHLIASVLFFLSISITAIVNFIEKKSILALIAFIAGSGSWILHEIGINCFGIALPEIISSIAVASLLQLSAIKIYFKYK